VDDGAGCAVDSPPAVERELADGEIVRGHAVDNEAQRVIWHRRARYFGRDVLRVDVLRALDLDEHGPGGPLVIAVPAVDPVVHGAGEVQPDAKRLDLAGHLKRDPLALVPSIQERVLAVVVAARAAPVVALPETGLVRLLRVLAVERVQRIIEPVSILGAVRDDVLPVSVGLARDLRRVPRQANCGRVPALQVRPGVHRRALVRPGRRRVRGGHASRAPRAHGAACAGGIVAVGAGLARLGSGERVELPCWARGAHSCPELGGNVPRAAVHAR
jgi:hypothetical protein